MHRFTLLVGGAVVTVALWAPVVGAQEQDQRRDYSQNEGPRYRDIGQDRREVARDVGNVRQDEREPATSRRSARTRERSGGTSARSRRTAPGSARI